MDHLKHDLTKGHCEPCPGAFIPHEGGKNLLPCKISFAVGYLSWGKDAGRPSLLSEFLPNSAGDVVTLLLRCNAPFTVSKPPHLRSVCCPFCSKLPKPKCPDPSLFSKLLCALCTTMGLVPGPRSHVDYQTS